MSDTLSIAASTVLFRAYDYSVIAPSTHFYLPREWYYKLGGSTKVLVLPTSLPSKVRVFSEYYFLIHYRNITN